MYSKYDDMWSPSFIIAMIIIVVVGRFASIFGAHFLFMGCCKKDVRFKDLIFISYGGVIRGAIAFGLVLKIPEQPEVFKERGVFITTTLSVVIFTTVLFGTFLKFVQGKLFGEEMKKNK
jgi:NhaP-type Na+/H+ or K+/H+ antiporter